MKRKGAQYIVSLKNEQVDKILVIWEKIKNDADKLLNLIFEDLDKE